METEYTTAALSGSTENIVIYPEINGMLDNMDTSASEQGTPSSEIIENGIGESNGIMTNIVEGGKVEKTTQPSPSPTASRRSGTNIMMEEHKPSQKLKQEDVLNKFDIKLPDSDNGYEGNVAQFSRGIDTKPDFVCVVNQDPLTISPSAVLHYVLDVDQQFDTIIVCADGKVGAHRLVLAAASPFLAGLFASHRLGEVATMILPELRIQILKILLIFIYTGSMTYPKELEEEIFDTMRILLIGEFGKLTRKKVKVKDNSTPVSSTSNLYSEMRQRQAILNSAEEEEAFAGASDYPADHRNPGWAPPSHGTTRRNRIIRTHVTEFGETSSNEDAESEGTGNESEDGTNKRKKKMKRKKSKGSIQKENDDDQRPMLNVHDNSGVCSYSYIIAPVPPGAKSKKLQCAECPACFKTMETLIEHLDDTHGIELSPLRPIERSEWHRLTRCNHCDKKYDNIAAANHCVSKHHRTRCLICFEDVKVKDFEDHILTHGNMEKNGTCIVACRWCEAGITFQTPFDNKAMAAHCFSQHFANISDAIKNSKAINEDSKSKNKEIKEKEKNASCSSSRPTPAAMPTTPFPIFAKAKSSTSTSNLQDRQSPSTSKEIPGSSSSGFVASSGGGGGTTPKAGPSSSKNSKYPSVLEMLQRASVKRKQSKEPDSPGGIGSETADSKRIRLDEEKENHDSDEDEESHVTNRSVKSTVGSPVSIDDLQAGAPKYFSSTEIVERLYNQEVPTIMLDIENLPNIYVKMPYSKKFIAEREMSLKLNCSISNIETDSHTHKDLNNEKGKNGELNQNQVLKRCSDDDSSDSETDNNDEDRDRPTTQQAELHSINEEEDNGGNSEFNQNENDDEESEIEGSCINNDDDASTNTSTADTIPEASASDPDEDGDIESELQVTNS